MIVLSYSNTNVSIYICFILFYRNVTLLLNLDGNCVNIAMA